jgi:P4 family phage/plasmid primase-like protien
MENINLNKRRFASIAEDSNTFHQPSNIAFNNFISTRISSIERFTHKSKDNVFYFIEDKHYDNFLELYFSTSNHTQFEIMECPKIIFPAVFKFEFIHEDDNAVSHSQPFIRIIVSTLYQKLKSLLKLDILTEYETCIVVKSNESWEYENGKWGDELYVHFPYIIFFPALFHLVRGMIINDDTIMEAYEDLNIENSVAESFIDNIEFPVGGLFEYLTYSPSGVPCRSSSFENLDALNVTRLLSIRKSKFSEVVPVTVLGEVSLTLTQEQLFSNEFIIKVLGLIDSNKVNSLDIAWALINIQSEFDFFPIFDEMYNSIEVNTWRNMQTNPSVKHSHKGLTTLLYIASIHSVALFRNLMFENIWILVKSCCDKYVQFYLDEKKKSDENTEEEMIISSKFQQYDSICFYLASIAKFFYGHLFVCSNIGRKIWYNFNGVNWVKSNRAVHLSKLFDSDLYSLFSYWSVIYYEEKVGDNWQHMKDQYSKSCSDFASFIRNHLKKKILIDVCAEHFYWDFHHILNNKIRSINFEELLDSNTNLIGCKNGIYDLSSHQFRNARPDDFIFLTTKNEFINFHWEHSKVIEVMDFMQKVFPIESVRNYVLKLFASFIDGNIEEQFYILTGSGSNGKSKLVELFQLSMGEYVATLPVSLITGKRTASSSATPELARMKGKRLGVLHESNVNDSINIGLVKAISGGDTMYARALHCDPIEFRPTFQLLLLCNDKPKRMDPYDFAIWRRIVVITFNSSFLDEPDPNNPLHFEKDDTIHTKLPQWKEAFFWILTQYHSDLCSNGNQIPNEIVNDTENYRDSSDYVQIFIKSKIERTEFFNDTIYLEDVFSRFKVFYSDYYQEQSRLKFVDFSNIIAKKLGDMVIFNRQKKGWTHYVFV